jgi:hypothetical protein
MVLGPLWDHYCCNLYYAPETCAYCILGSTELFPQHCQLPALTPHQLLPKLTDELVTKCSSTGNTTKGQRLLKLLQSHIGNILTLLPPRPVLQPEQRVEQRVSMDKQRVIKDTPIPTLQQISNAPAIIALGKPTAKRSLKVTPCVHQQLTLNNTPEGVPLITRSKLARIINEDEDITPALATRTRSAIPMARAGLVSQQALTVTMMNKMFNPPPAFTLRVLASSAPMPPISTLNITLFQWSIQSQRRLSPATAS